MATTELTDESPFPCHTHKDKKMKDVPMNYLEWFIKQTWAKGYPEVARYVAAKQAKQDEPKLL